MKPTFQLLLAALTAAAGILLAGCKNDSAQTKDSAPESGHYIGTWHYELVTQTMAGAAADTMRFDYVANPHEQQLYEVYTPDSVMLFYTVQGDSLLSKREYRYSFRNDTLYMSHPDKPLQSVHVVLHTDSIRVIDYIRTYRDTTFYCTSTIRRSELPAWLKE